MHMFLKNTDKLDSIGKRIRFIRRVVGSSRQEFEKTCAINANTLQAWESNRITPRAKSIDKLLSALSLSFNVICTKNWLLTGRGVFPSIIGQSILESLPISKIKDEHSIANEIQLFEASDANAIVILVSEDSAVPQYHLGDYVGGIKKFGKKINEDVGYACIVELEDGVTLIRRILKSKGGKYTLVPINMDITSDEEIHYNINVSYVARILWHRKLTSD